MLVIIDAYNVMKTVFICRGVRFLREKQFFIRSIGRYRALRKESISQIILCFDGGSGLRKTREVVGGVVVMHSGSSMSADDVILDCVKHYREQEILVVTNDISLRRRAEQIGVYLAGMESEAFWELVQKTIFLQEKKEMRNKRGHSIQKIEHECIEGAVNDEFDLLMMMQSMEIPEKSEDMCTVKKNVQRGEQKKGSVRSILKKI